MLLYRLHRVLLTARSQATVYTDKNLLGGHFNRPRQGHILARMEKKESNMGNQKSKQKVEAKETAEPPPFITDRKDFSTSRVTRSVVKEEEKNDKETYLKMSLEEKRQKYKCKDKYVELHQIHTWNETGPELMKNYGSNTFKPEFKCSDLLNSKVAVFKGNITTLEIDVIANAANGSLLGGGGVDGAIHQAAGRKLVVESARLGGCDTGDAKITGGYKLPAKYVIHTVGPIGENPSKLASCYKRCLEVLTDNDLRTVAFPCISTGIYGYDVEKATPVAMRTVRRWLETSGNVDKDVQVYQTNMFKIFPIKCDGSDGNRPISERGQEKKKGKEETQKGPAQEEQRHSGSDRLSRPDNDSEGTENMDSAVDGVGDKSPVQPSDDKEKSVLTAGKESSKENVPASDDDLKPPETKKLNTEV